MHEDAVAAEVMTWWTTSYPTDFSPSSNHSLQVPYPAVPGAKCDLVFTTDGHQSEPEWAIEVKRIQLVGDNGKNNDYGVAKMLSPYLKDRSLIHDIHRLRHYGFARRHAVVGYTFSYSFDLLTEAHDRHPNEREVLANLKAVLRTNDRDMGQLRGADLVVAANAIFVSQGLVADKVEIEEFVGLWRHPCGGSGMVFGWEVQSIPSGDGTLFDVR